MDRATCLGGTEVYVESGYWRKNANSTHISECMHEEACKGGLVTENEHPVE